MFPYDSAGVDVTLIRWMLSMTPAERLATLQDFVDFVWEAGTVTVRKGAISVGQDGILRGDWQSPRVPVANRHAACQVAPQKHNFTRSRY